MSLGHNFLALHAKADTGATITVDTGDGPKTLDSDGIVIIQLREDVTEITFTASKSGVTESKTFSFMGIEKEAE